MKLRALSTKDAPALTALATASGFEYPDIYNPHIESVSVVEDDAGNVIAAVAAERIIQLYLYLDHGLKPIDAKHALRILHGGVAMDLKGRGYNEANCFIPPSIWEKFSRRLKRSFGWRDNWQSLFLRF